MPTACLDDGGKHPGGYPAHRTGCACRFSPSGDGDGSDQRKPALSRDPPAPFSRGSGTIHRYVVSAKRVSHAPCRSGLETVPTLQSVRRPTRETPDRRVRGLSLSGPGTTARYHARCLRARSHQVLPLDGTRLHSLPYVLPGPKRQHAATLSRLSTHSEFPVLCLWHSPQWLSERTTQDDVSSVRLAPFTVTHDLRFVFHATFKTQKTQLETARVCTTFQA